MTEHEKGLNRAKKLCLALSVTQTRSDNFFKVSTIANTFTHHQYRLNYTNNIVDNYNTFKSNLYEITDTDFRDFFNLSQGVIADTKGLL